MSDMASGIAIANIETMATGSLVKNIATTTDSYAVAANDAGTHVLSLNTNELEIYEISTDSLIGSLAGVNG